MARRPIGAASEGTSREGFENFTLRLPAAQSDRMAKFATRHRLSVGEMFTFGLNAAAVKADGSDRRMIDYGKLNALLEDNASGVIAHSGRFYLSEVGRIKTFRRAHNLSLPLLLVYLMDEIGVAPDGAGLMWIDYETLSIRERA